MVGVAWPQQDSLGSSSQRSWAVFYTLVCPPLRFVIITLFALGGSEDPGKGMLVLGLLLQPENLI